MAELMLTGGTEFFDKTFEEHMNDRRIIINDEINQNIIETAVLQIMKFNKQDKYIPVEQRKPIYLYISSVGGDVFSGLSLISAIESSKTPVVGIVLSYGWSMGCVIFCACHKRYMLDNATLLIHDGSTALSGSSGKVKDLQKFYERVDTKIKDIIVSNSTISEEEYDENADRELYLFADECREKGLCDGIIGKDIELDFIL